MTTCRAGVLVRAEQPWDQNTYGGAGLDQAIQVLVNTYTTRFEAQGWAFPLTILVNEVYPADDEPLPPFELKLLGRDRHGKAHWKAEGL